MRLRWMLCIALAMLIMAQVVASMAWQRRPQMSVPGATEGTIVIPEIDPGEIAGTLMLAGMRGLAIDILWMRAITAKEAGRYYESVALFQLISKTQPQFETVWEYMVWDMAYNIPADMDDDEARFSWYVTAVAAGVEGAMRNPRGERLLRYLAWMILHRGQQFVDRVEAYDWEPVLGPLLEQAGMEVPAVGASPYRLGATLYAFIIDQAPQRAYRVPSFVRRLLPINLEHDGNLARNRGHHRQAVERYLEALEWWQHAHAWIAEQRQTLEDGSIPDWEQPRVRDQILLTQRTAQRIEGPLRRKVANILRLLAPNDDHADTAEALLAGNDFPALRAMLYEDGWSAQVPHAPRIQWYDEL